MTDLSHHMNYYPSAYIILTPILLPFTVPCATKWHMGQEVTDLILFVNLAVHSPKTYRDLILLVYLLLHYLSLQLFNYLKSEKEVRIQNSWVTDESHPLFHQETNLRAVLTSAHFCKVSETEKSHFICVTSAFSLQQKITNTSHLSLGKNSTFLTNYTDSEWWAV